MVAHRGTWFEPNEKNSEKAFIRSAEKNFGIETDVRDYNGKLVIAHDIPGPGKEHMPFEDFLALYYTHSQQPGMLAINIKSDGLQSLLAKALQEANATRYFVFDMSIPDTLGYKNNGIPFYSRVSEYEPHAAFENECAGIWLDAFNSIWYGIDMIREWLDKGKKVCLVSPELHRRPYYAFWELLKSEGLHLHRELLLCTDFPEEATNFFNEP